MFEDEGILLMVNDSWKPVEFLVCTKPCMKVLLLFSPSSWTQRSLPIIFWTNSCYTAQLALQLSYNFGGGGGADQAPLSCHSFSYSHATEYSCSNAVKALSLFFPLLHMQHQNPNRKRKKTRYPYPVNQHSNQRRIGGLTDKPVTTCWLRPTPVSKKNWF